MKKSSNLFKVCVLSVFVGLTLVAGSVSASFETLKLDHGRYVTYESIKVKGAKYTVILLPGINRNLQSETESPFFAALKREKLNVVTIATSSHPQSISQIPEDETFIGFEKNMTARDYAEEVEAVAKALKLRFPYVASLSYSSSILSELDSNLFGGLIETVPMGDPVEGLSGQIKSGRDAQDWLKITNPFFGPSIVRSQRDSAYKSQWKASVENRLEQDPEFYGPNPNIESIVEGYVSLARAAEDYRIVKTDLSVPRIWILASDESEERFALQLKAVQNDFKKFKGNSSLLVVAGSGHVLPADKPVAAAKGIQLAIEMFQSEEFVSGILVDAELTEFTEEQKKGLGIQ